MQKGFMKAVLPLIRANPGLSAEEYASIALERDPELSVSKNPNFSLSTTLRKEVREGRRPEIKAITVNGKLHFFPADYGTGQLVPPPRRDSTSRILLPPDVAQAADTLVELGKYANRGEALIWLAREGIKANQPKLKNAESALQQIRALKESVYV
ncbi:MAG: hypothetical protein V1737_05685 [Chloroflexota bacterium]